MLLTSFACSTLLYLSLTHGASVHRRGGPTVQLDGATVVGTTHGSVDSFLGVPFAQPPVGDLRLRLPVPQTAYSGVVDATAFGNQCIQQPQPAPPGVPAELLPVIAPLVVALSANPDVPQSEDCLNLNVIRPANITPDAKLPVLVWIYGGGFEIGSNAITFYNGTAVVQRSIDLGEPIIFVAVNYRLHAFGFLGGKEVKDAGVGNLGLQDQRAALRWLNRYISSFGGDPSKVTIWGESAGAISVAMHMITNEGNTEGLFRAGIMNSGSTVPTGDITDVQDTYDLVVNEVGCAGSADTLACLRTVSSDALLKAATDTPSSISFIGLATPYVPRADGIFVTKPPQELALDGNLAKIPFIIGDVKDEGTLLSLGIMNITTDAEFAAYLPQFWFPGASPADLNPLLALYSSDPAAGSPFDTGSANAFTPEYKRIAAVEGDWFFNAPRRQLLQMYASTQTAYNFLSTRNSLPGLGAAHASDLFTAFAPGDMTDYFIRFVNDLDPNDARSGEVQWPRFDLSTRSTLQFNDGDVPLEITQDVARMDGTDALSTLSLRFPI